MQTTVEDGAVEERLNAGLEQGAVGPRRKAMGITQQLMAGAAAPQGMMVHNYDHQEWREYAERYIRAIVGRYKDRPSLLVWGTCDAVNLASAMCDTDGYPPYNDYTIEKYTHWLKERYSLDELNERLLRRYRLWEDVQPPRSNDALVEMMLYRQFHYENMADMLGWMADLIDRIDGKHEQRSHGWYIPRPMDEMASERVDSWGLSFPSADLLTSDNPCAIAVRNIGFDWSRAIGKSGRWWAEEIYAGAVGGLAAEPFIPLGKQAAPEELTALLWLSLAAGAAGALFWQYRPEYMSLEAPGLNLASLDGTPTRRLHAIEQAIGQIDTIKAHLPLQLPLAEMALAYSGPSAEIFNYAGQSKRFKRDLTGIYRTLWRNSIPQDMVTPRMDWSRYKAVYLPNFAVLDKVAIKRIKEVLQECPQTHIIADGHFGTFAGKGHWSFHPPEGLDDLVSVRIADSEWITARDIREGRNVLVTEYGEFAVASECGYAILEPLGDTKPIATLNGEIVAIESIGRRLTWWGLSLSGAFGGVGPEKLILPLFASYRVGSPFSIAGARLVAFRRTSKQGGSLIFLFNLEPQTARARVKVNWQIGSVTDLFERHDLEVDRGSFQVELPPGSVKVFHTADA